MSAIHWWKLKNLSLAQAVRNAGFDLSIYDYYGVDVKAEMKRRAINEMMYEISDRFWDETKEKLDLKDIKKGVYVICLSDPFTLSYPQKAANIIYIGMGNICGRLKSHFDTTLFSLMQSLSGTNFDFYFSEPKRTGGGKSNHYHKQIECSLLEGFKNKFGSKENPYPLLNKNAGSDKKIAPGKGWDKPLKLAGKKPKWTLKPTAYWQFKKLTDPR